MFYKLLIIIEQWNASTGEETLSERDLGPVEAIMHNICLCHLHPLQHGLAIVIK